VKMNAQPSLGETAPPFWLCCILAGLVGTFLAVSEDSSSHGGTGPMSHLDGDVADSASSLLSWSLYSDGGGLGVLEPLRELFVNRPQGLYGIGGLIAFASSLLAAVGGLGQVAWRAVWPKKKAKHDHSSGPSSSTHEKIKMSFQVEMKCYSGYVFLLVMGLVREYTIRFLAAVTGDPLYTTYVKRERWVAGWADFYLNHCKTYVEECLARPITNAPDATFNVSVRSRPGGIMFEPLHKLQRTGEVKKCVNLSSYNYLGFGGIDTYCTPAARAMALDVGYSAAGTRNEGGTMAVHRELEQEVAGFLDKEDAIVLGMGFASNSCMLPALFEAKAGGKGILAISDELNHRSIVEGVRLSGCSIRAFAHNNMPALEAELKRAVEEGQPNGKPWRKIFVVVEGIYSMEGDFCRLREIVTLKNRYKAYLYLDEAHSIGAVGPHGKGLADLFSIPTSEIDVMMGTFTKSFGSAGGYVAATKDVIDSLRRNAPGSVFASAMAPPCAAQALAAFKVIAGKAGGDIGAKKLAAIKENANFFRKSLDQAGFKTLGDVDSPIIPMMIHHPLKMKWFSQMCMDRGIAVVVVGYPAVPLQYERCRFCISAAHTNEQLSAVLKDVIDIGTKLGIRYEVDYDPELKSARDKREDEYAQWLRSAPMETGSSVSSVPAAAAAYQPEALAPALRDFGLSKAALDVVKTVEPRSSVDFRLHDPLGYALRPDPAAKRAIEQTMDVYGFGACGPRGFYGSTLPHLDLEIDIAKFLGTQGAIVYSAGAVTISSVLPALVQPGDKVVIDSEIGMGARAGLRLCKAEVSWVPYGDVDAFATAVRKFSEAASVQKKGERQPRIFILTEAICQRTGQLAPLAELVALKEKFGALLVLDETLSFGTLGAHGKGLCEHCDISPDRVDAIVGSLEHAVANVGGFCAGRSGLVEHQRLGGAGYCFSASSPPSSCSAASALVRALGEGDSDSAQRLTKLQSNAARLHEVAREALPPSGSGVPVELLSSPNSYVQHLRWTGSTSADEAEARLLAVAEACKAAPEAVRIQVTVPGSCSAEVAFGERIGAPALPMPSIRLCASAEQSCADITALGKVLRAALKTV